MPVAKTANWLASIHANDGIVVSSHARVGNIGGAAGKNAVICARCVGMRPHDKTNSSVAEMAHGLLFSGCLAVEVEHDRIDVSLQPMYL